MANPQPKAAIRLVGGPAEGFVMTVPEAKIPPSVCVGNARYDREPGDGAVLIYRFSGMTH